MAKAGARDKLTLACTECKQRNYQTYKNKKNNTERLELKKYCPFCRKHTIHSAELKRVTWPTGEKLAKTAAVVLLVIVFFAVYLTLIGNGGRWILDKVGFYDIVETTVPVETVAPVEATTAATEASETVEETESSVEG